MCTLRTGYPQREVVNIAFSLLWGPIGPGWYAGERLESTKALSLGAHDCFKIPKQSVSGLNSGTQGMNGREPEVSADGAGH